MASIPGMLSNILALINLRFLMLIHAENLKYILC
jgi:hypothetical protein